MWYNISATSAAQEGSTLSMWMICDSLYDVGGKREASKKIGLVQKEAEAEVEERGGAKMTNSLSVVRNKRALLATVICIHLSPFQPRG